MSTAHLGDYTQKSCCYSPIRPRFAIMVSSPPMTKTLPMIRWTSCQNCLSICSRRRQKILATKAEELEPTREACESIMNAAFGGLPWKTDVDNAQPKERRGVILKYKDLLHDASASTCCRSRFGRLKTATSIISFTPRSRHMAMKR